MKSYRIIHQILFVFSFVPMMLNLGPWYLMILLPLATLIPYGLNEKAIQRKESAIAAEHSPHCVSTVEHAYNESADPR